MLCFAQKSLYIFPGVWPQQDFLVAGGVVCLQAKRMVGFCDVVLVHHAQPFSVFCYAVNCHQKFKAWPFLYFDLRT